MATELTNNIISSKSKSGEIAFADINGSGTDMTFEFAMNDADDNGFVVIDASRAQDTQSFNAYFARGDGIASSAAAHSVIGGKVVFIPLNSSIFKKKDGKAVITVETNDTMPIAPSNLKIAVVKQRFVKNN